MAERIVSEQEIRDIFARDKQRREKVCRTMEKVVSKLKKEISEKNEILVTPEDLGKKLGLVSTLQHPIAIYHDAQYCLWKHGIYVKGFRPEKSLRIKTILIRTRKPDDELSKYLGIKEDEIRRLAKQLSPKNV
jgi:transcription initiation factor IIE alpha subunit